MGSNCGRKSGFSASSAKALRLVIGKGIVRTYNSAYRAYTVVIP